MLAKTLETHEVDYGTLVRELAAESHRLLNDRAFLGSDLAELNALIDRVSRLHKRLDGTGFTELKTWLCALGERLEIERTRRERARKRPVRVPAGTR